jgi:Ankyrin repeats (many copies)
MIVNYFAGQCRKITVMEDAMTKDEARKLGQLREHYEVATAKLLPSQKRAVTEYINALLSVLGHRQGESQFVKDHIDAMQIGETYQGMIPLGDFGFHQFIGANPMGELKPTTPWTVNDHLFNAAGAGQNKWIDRLIIENGADLNAVDDYGSGRTALHWATLANKPSTVTHLIKRGANPNIKDSESLTPLDVAKNVKNNEVVAILTRAMKHKIGHADRLDKQRGKSGGAEIGD